MTPTDLVQRLYRVGLAAVPCCAPQGDGCTARWHSKPSELPCSNVGKRPLVKGYPSYAELPPFDELLDNFRRATFETNLAVVVPTGHVVIEADSPEADVEVVGLLSEVVTPTRAARPNRGRAWILRLPDDTEIVGRCHLGESKTIDVRAPGQILVVPPSKHKSGHVYTWVRGREPWSIAIADAPEALLNLLSRQATRPFTPHAIADADDRPPEDSLPALDARVGQARAHLAGMPPAIQGQNGSAACLRAAIALVRGFCLPFNTALAVLSNEYNPRCEPPWSDAELYHKVEDAELVCRAPWGYLLDTETVAASDECAPMPILPNEPREWK